MESVPVAPRSGFPIKMVVSIFYFLSRLTDCFYSYVLQRHLGETNPVEQRKIHEIKRFAHQRPTPC